MSRDDHQGPEGNESTQQPDSPGSASEITASNDEVLDDNGRRMFLKRAALGGGGALLAGAGSFGFIKSEIKGKPVSDYPLVDPAIFKPKDQRDTVLGFAHSKALGEKYPERTTQYNNLQNKDFNFQEGFDEMYAKPWDNSRPGYTQMDRALQKGRLPYLAQYSCRDSGADCSARWVCT